MSCIRKVIVDVDCGVDDYLALLILLQAQQQNEVNIEAIVCSNGNTSVENVCKNVVRLLEIIKRTDIPVFKGASKQLILFHNISSPFHGKDGFGDLKHEHEPDLTIIKETPAALAIYDIVKNKPGEIDLICLAPLTNVALAARLYDDFISKVKGIYIMGGNYTAVGNTTSCAEFNFYVDPEAVHIVLSSVTCPVEIVTWETCLQPQITYEWRYEVLAKIKSAPFDLLTQAEKKCYPKDSNIWLTADSYLIVAYLYPQHAIVKKSEHNATIELHGTHTRGQLVLDHLKLKPPNVTIIETINEEFFKTILVKTAKSFE